MRLIWISGALALGLLVGLGWYLSPLSPGVLPLQFAFTPRSFGSIIHQWSPSQLALYRSHFPADFCLLASYGVFGYCMASNTSVFARARPVVRAMARWLLPVAAAFDAAENVLHLWLTEAPRLDVWLPYLASGIASVLKWALLLGFIALTAAALRRSER